MRENTRRRFLKTGLVVTGAAIAGCTDAGSDADDGTDEPREANGSDTGNETNAATEQETNDEAASGETDGTAEEENASDSAETKEESDTEPLFPDYETTAVRVERPDGEELGSVTAAIAETSDEWSLGLSDTESLPEDWGMLFVSGSMSDLTFWMKEMDFGLDIVFVDDEKRITGIHHAPAPGPEEDGTDQRYSGRGQYVLEVNYEWTERRGVTEGDVLQFER